MLDNKETTMFKMLRPVRLLSQSRRYREEDAMLSELSRSIRDYIPDERLAALNRPIGEAVGLPPFVYTSQEYFEFEQRKLFHQGWMGVCFAHQVPDPGDALPLSVAGIPVIVVRGKTGDVRAFHNVCRHRGTTVLPEPEKAVTRFRCIYHSWTYGIDGELLTTPFWDSEKTGKPPPLSNAIDRAANGLVPIRCDVLWDVVYVDISGEAPPLEDNFAAAVEDWGRYDWDGLNATVTDEQISNCNWKLGVEGLLDFYHEPFIHPQLRWQHPDHPGLAPQPNNIVEECFIELQDKSIWLATDWVVGHRQTGWPEGLEPVSETPAFDHRSYIMSLFPNVAMGVLSDHTITLMWLPLAPDKTLLKAAVYFPGDHPADPETEKKREQAAGFWGEINDQDVMATEAQQEARHSIVSDDTKFCSFGEEMVHYFQQRYVRELE